MKKHPKNRLSPVNENLIFSFFFGLLVLLTCPGLAEVEPFDLALNEDSVVQISSEEMRRGERLFHGLLPVDENYTSCASCHNTHVIDSMNWNPDAIEIANKYIDKPFDEFKKTILSPRGKVLSKVHAGYDYSETDVILLKAYLHALAKKGLVPPKKNLNRLLLFLGGLFLLFLALADLIFMKRIKFKGIHLLLITVALFIDTKIIVEEAVAIGRSEGYAPDQPIKFSHAVHVKQNQTDCIYCHHAAEHAKQAGIPATSTCMNCHVIVREGSHSGKSEINKIYQSMDDSVAIRWTEVYRLPDHVFFNHAQHVTIAGVDCKKCHGDVDNMHRMEQIRGLSMGWCVNCHRETGVAFESNKFYQSYEKIKNDLQANRVDSVTADMVGSTDCMKCHY